MKPNQSGRGNNFTHHYDQEVLEAHMLEHSLQLAIKKTLSGIYHPEDDSVGINVEGEWDGISRSSIRVTQSEVFLHEALEHEASAAETAFVVSFWLWDADLWQALIPMDEIQQSGQYDEGQAKIIRITQAVGFHEGFPSSGAFSTTGGVFFDEVEYYDVDISEDIKQLIGFRSEYVKDCLKVAQPFHDLIKKFLKSEPAKDERKEFFDCLSWLIKNATSEEPEKKSRADKVITICELGVTAEQFIKIVRKNS
jgi:hypothetical protein